VAGPNPARVVIDPSGRLPARARLLTADGARRLVMTADDKRPTLPPDIEVVLLQRSNGQMAPAAILEALAARGLRRVLIEGGADTVSRFLMAGCLHRLHVMVAPIILGSGRPGLTLPTISRADEALRSPVRVHQFGDEVLFDCDLSPQLGRANTST
jgi:riboflavin biosynthesis pyrimidine reductase